MALDHENLIDSMIQNKDDDQPFVLATVVRTEDATAGKPGNKAIIRADGTVIGWVGGGCALGAVKKAAAAALEDGRPRLIRVKPKDMLEDEVPVDGLELHPSSCPSRGTTEVFIDPIMQRPSILVVGTSPVAKSLCELAKPLGYTVTVAGPADDLAAFEDADQRIDNLDPLPDDAPSFHFVVVSTQGKRDRDSLIFGLSAGAGYVAFVASRRKAEKIKGDLLEAGLDPERVAAVRSPAGLEIGAETPDEIALSIISEIVSERRLGKGNSAGQPGENGAEGGPYPRLAGTAPGREQ